MEWEGRMCIVSGSYQSIDSPSPRTVVELWCRAEEGHSVLLLVHGLRPYFDIAVRGAPTRIPSRPRVGKRNRRGNGSIRTSHEVD